MYRIKIDPSFWPPCIKCSKFKNILLSLDYYLFFLIIHNILLESIYNHKCFLYLYFKWKISYIPQSCRYKIMVHFNLEKKNFYYSKLRMVYTKYKHTIIIHVNIYIWINRRWRSYHYAVPTLYWKDLCT